MLSGLGDCSVDSMSSVLPVLVILFVSTFTRSSLGFGDALIAMPLLTLVVGSQTASPLVAFGASTIAITILLGGWQRVDMRAAWRLIVSSLVGIPIGLFFLKTAPESIVKVILGVVLIGFSLYNLIAPRLLAGQADVLEQMVVEPRQLAERPALGAALEPEAKHREPPASQR